MGRGEPRSRAGCGSGDGSETGSRGPRSATRARRRDDAPIAGEDAPTAASQGLVPEFPNYQRPAKPATRAPVPAAGKASPFLQNLKARDGVPAGRLMISHYGNGRGDHESSDEWFCNRGRALGGGGTARRGGGRRVLLLGADDGRVLPAIVRVAAGAARECCISFDLRGGGTGGIPAVQTLPAERGGACGTARGGGGQGVPCDRGADGRAGTAGRTRGGGGDEPLPLSPRLPSDHGSDAKGIRGQLARRSGCAANLQRSRTVTEAIYGAGYNSSGRFYEQSAEILGMTPTDFRAGGRAGVDPLRGGRVLARVDTGGGDGEGRVRDPDGRRPERAGGATCRSVFRGPR